MAEAFAHKPTCLGVGEDDRPISVCHNGTQDGVLYVVGEPVSEEDVRAHPDSSLGGRLEWLTQRPLRLRKIADLPIADPPCRPDCPRRARPQ